MNTRPCRVLNKRLFFMFNIQISNSGGVDVGAITWLWNGCAKQAFTDSDSFGVRFPAGANLQQRALVLGATMLLVSILKYLVHSIKHIVLNGSS